MGAGRYIRPSMAGWTARVLIASTLLVGVCVAPVALAAEPAAPAVTSSSAPASQPVSPSGAPARSGGGEAPGGANRACFPACRPGYICHEGQCVSMCNPPCAEDHVCVDGVRCELPSEPAPAREPVPPPLPPRGLANRTYSAIGFHLGFSGSADRGGLSQDLAPTLGFNIRADIPVVKYILVGPLVQFGAWRPEAQGGSAPSRNYYVDIDLYLRGRIPIDVDTLGVQVWAGVPIGLTLSFLGNDEGAGLDGFGVGWNVGVMFGGAVHFSNKFGIFTELGWLQHKMSHDRSPGSGSVDLKTSQGVFNIGFLFGD
jgi:hypothetical protein